MAAVRVYLALLLTALLFTRAANAQEKHSPWIYDRPVLVADFRSPFCSNYKCFGRSFGTLGRYGVV